MPENETFATFEEPIELEISDDSIVMSERLDDGSSILTLDTVDGQEVNLHLGRDVFEAMRRHFKFDV